MVIPRALLFENREDNNMEQIKSWYNGLEQNEKKIVLLGGIAIAVAIIFLVVLKPLNGKVKSLQISVDSKSQTIAEWRASVPKLIANRGGATNSSDGQALSAIVTSSTRQFNLRVSRVQEKGNEEIQVWFDNVPFNDFANWVAELNNRHGVAVASANIRSKDRDGLTSIDVKLRKG